MNDLEFCRFVFRLESLRKNSEKYSNSKDSYDRGYFAGASDTIDIILGMLYEHTR